MYNLSIVIIAKNEEKRIEKCLKSVKFASEIILVDSGSNDNTIKIAEKFGAKVFKRDFDNYGYQKYFAVTKATKKWILCIDADEIVSKKLSSEIKNIVKLDNNEISGYFIPYKNFFMNKPLDCLDERYYQLRLFKKEKGNFIRSEVHERIKVNGKTFYLKNYMYHHSYRSISQILKKFDDYTDKEAKLRYNNNRIFRARQLLYYPLSIFFRRFFIKKGYKDGIHGLVLTILFMYYQFCVYLKLWQLGENSK